MIKTIEENKLTVTIKRLSCEFNLFWKFICLNKNNDQNKTNLPLPPSTSVKVFLIAENYQAYVFEIFRLSVCFY